MDTAWPLAERPVRPAGQWSLTAATGAYLAFVVLSAQPGLRGAPWPVRLEILAYNVMASANLIVLNLILVRGTARPIRLAVWCLSTAS